MIMKEQLSFGTKVLNAFLGVTVASLVLILAAVVVCVILEAVGII